jgi:NAD(P)-dependent dehydrogenase (short-subunit alcohol dehydrogenase family)
MVALVTGAAVGIGRAIALALLAEGMETWLADVQDPEGPEGRFVRLDVTDAAALRTVMGEAKPDVLVNNAGGIPAGHTEIEILELNLRSAMQATTRALEHGAPGDHQRRVGSWGSRPQRTPRRPAPPRRPADPLHHRTRRSGAPELQRARLDRHPRGGCARRPK